VRFHYLLLIYSVFVLGLTLFSGWDHYATAQTATITTSSIYTGGIVITLSRTSGTVSASISTPMELTKVSITIPGQGQGVVIVPNPIVSFVCSGQPSGVSVQFDPNPLTVPWDAMPHTTVMSATTQSTVQPGIYDLTISIIFHLDDAIIIMKEAHYQLVIPGVPGFDLSSIAAGIGLGALVLIMIQRRKPRILERSKRNSCIKRFISEKSLSMKCGCLV